MSEVMFTPANPKPRMPGDAAATGQRIRHARWEIFSPVELEKELALLKRSGCKSELIAEAEAALMAKRDAFRVKYPAK